MSEYIDVTKTLHVRRDSQDLFEQADTVLFDIDGVLIDVRGSFREVVRETVQFYIKKKYDIDSREKLIDREDITLLKMTGGFNNDWDLTEALLAYYIRKMVKTGIRELLEAKVAEPTLADFMAEVKDLGGGLESVYSLLYQDMTDQDIVTFKENVRRDEIEQIFQELYAGNDYCMQLYGRRGSFYRGRGKITNEKLLLKSSLLMTDAMKYGVFTGRTANETALALDRLGAANKFKKGTVLCDDGTLPVKPDSAGLGVLIKTLQSTGAIYCGDTIDDWKAVEHFKTTSSIPMQFCYCRTGATTEDTVEHFKSLGVDAVAEDVNSLLIWLAAQKRR